MKHAKPSRKAARNGWIAVAVLEAVGVYAATYALSGLYWYASIDASSPMAIQSMAKNAQVYLTVAIWAVYAIGMPIAIWHDWPTSADGKAVYDATHEQARMAPRLKLGDDIANFIRNKGSIPSPASTIYGDLQAIQAADDTATTVQPAPQQEKG